MGEGWDEGDTPHLNNLLGWRRSCGRISEVSTARARELRANMTDVERWLWSQLRSRQFGSYKFRRQQPIGPYVVDFVCFEKKVVIELDGGQHNEAEQASYDSARTEWLLAKMF